MQLAILINQSYYLLSWAARVWLRSTKQELGCDLQLSLLLLTPTAKPRESQKPRNAFCLFSYHSLPDMSLKCSPVAGAVTLCLSVVNQSSRNLAKCTGKYLKILVTHEVWPVPFIYWLMANSRGKKVDWDGFGQQKNCFKMSLINLFEVMSVPKYCEMLVRRGWALSPIEFGTKCVWI